MGLFIMDVTPSKILDVLLKNKENRRKSKLR